MHAVDDTFVALADLMRPAPPVVADVAPAPNEAEALPARAPRDEEAIARDVRVFRAQLLDAFEASHDALLREFAYAVLGRELILGACDVAAIAQRIIAEHPAARPLRLRVAHDDTYALAAHAEVLPPFVADATLAPGDVIVEFADEHVDGRLGVRLRAVLDNVV